MSKEKLKVKKKKEREIRVRKQLLLARECKRLRDKEEREHQKKLDRIGKLKREMGDLNVWSDDVLMKLSDEKMAQLERNAQILKALEEEHEANREKKSTLNKELEDAGLFTLEEKLAHLQKNLTKDIESSVGVVETNCDSEVAEVEVVREQSCHSGCCSSNN